MSDTNTVNTSNRAQRVAEAVVSAYINEIAPTDRLRSQGRRRDDCTESKPVVRLRGPHAGHAHGSAFVPWRGPALQPAA